jgi:hypothetical protein
MYLIVPRFISSFDISHHTSLSFDLKISSLISQKKKKNMAAELLYVFHGADFEKAELHSC